MANKSSVVISTDPATHTQYNNLRLDAIGPFDAERVWNDNQHARFGTLGADGDVYSDGADLFIDNPSGGNINLQVAGVTRLQVTSTGFNLVGDQLFGDNEKATFGDAADASIYWDGSKLVIGGSTVQATGLSITESQISDLAHYGDSDVDTIVATHAAIADAHHAKYLDSAAIAAVEAEATLDLAGDVTIAALKSLTVDTINETTLDGGVTVDGVLLKDGLVDGIDVAARDHAVYTDGEAVSAVGTPWVALIAAEDHHTIYQDSAAVAAVELAGLSTPALGTPSALVGTNITGTASGLTAGNVTTNANLTGHVTSTGNAAILGSFTKAQLSAAVSDGTPLYSGDVTIYTDAEAIAAVEGEATLNLSGTVAIGGELLLADTKAISFGTAGQSGIRASLTTDQLVLNLGADVGKQFVLGAFLGSSRDYDHVTPATPTLFIHSGQDPDVANDEWVSLYHDGTDGQIGLGSGILKIPAGATVGGSPVVVDSDIGSTVQAYDADLTALAGIGTAVQGDIIYSDVNGSWARLAEGTDAFILTLAGGVPTWAAGGGGYSDAEAIAAVQGEATLDLTGLVTIAVGKSLAVDTILEKGAGTGVTIDGVLLKDGLVDGIDVAARDHAVYTDAEALAAVPASSTTVAGKIELATVAETSAGTSTSRANTPDGLAGSVYGEKVVTFGVLSPIAPNFVGDDQAHFHVPSSLNGFNVVEVHAEVITAGTTGAMTVMIRNDTQGANILSTGLDIDSGETGSDTGGGATIDTAQDDLQTNDLIAIDVDAVQTTPALGLIVTMVCRKP